MVDYKKIITQNAEQVRRLHKRVHETMRFRDNGPKAWDEWRQACAEFHARYDALAFPEDYELVISAPEKLDECTKEATLCFLELRPYFFRSGYMYDKLLRKIKHADLSEAQKRRLQVILNKRASWKQLKAT